MNKLRDLVRRSVTSGAQVFADVEHTALGMASVRLSKNGTRLTNLRVVGQPVRVGQKVIVDASAEGTPVVRPLTIAEPTVTEELDKAPWIDFPEPGFAAEPPPIPGGGETFEVVAGKVTRQSARIETFTSAFYTRDDISLTKTLYDTHDLFDAATGVLKAEQQPGTYMMRYTIAITPQPTIGWFSVRFRYVYSKETPKRVYGYSLPVIVSTTVIVRYPANWNTVRRPRINWMMGDAVPAPGYVSSITLPVLANKYPILEWWRISPYTSTTPEASPYWYWYG